MIRRKSIEQTLLLGGLFCLAVVVGMMIYSSKISKELEKQLMQSLKDVGDQNEMTLESELENKFSLIEGVAEWLGKLETIKPSQVGDLLGEFRNIYEFNDMGVIFLDGIAYTTEGEKLNLSKQDAFKEGIQGKRHISGRIKKIFGEEDVNMYTVPIIGATDQKIKGIVFATYDITQFRTLLEITSFEGNGYSYIMKRDGEVVVDTEKAKIYGSENVFDAMTENGENNEEAIAKMKKDVSEGKSGYIRYNYEEQKYLYYVPSKTVDWYLLTIVPSRVLKERVTPIVWKTNVICVSTILIALAGSAGFILTNKRQNKEVFELAYIDPITGGNNYAKFSKVAQELLEEKKKNLALVSLDLDKFKLINELFGFEKGNELIKKMWDVIKKELRSGEVSGHSVADQFLMLLSYENQDELERRIQRIQKKIENLSVDKYMKETNPSLGLYLIPKGNNVASLDNMYNYAGMARRVVKGRKDEHYAIYNEEIRDKMLENKMLEDRFFYGIEHREFQPWYQPKYDIDGKTLIGAEALVRWIKEDGEMILPGKFIPLFEQNGLITPLDDLIFEMVCKQQKEWLDEGISIVPVSVNISRAHLFQGTFLQQYGKTLSEVGISSEYIQLEVTESAAKENKEIFPLIQELKNNGHKILLDDFGTGYSSLMSLEEIKFDTLKLDKSFVDAIGSERGEKLIVYTIQLAKSLGMEITAEGVETEEQYQFLKENECSNIQGYYFAKPMPAKEFEKLLREQMKKEGQ